MKVRPHPLSPPLQHIYNRVRTAQRAIQTIHLSSGSLSTISLYIFFTFPFPPQSTMLWKTFVVMLMFVCVVLIAAVVVVVFFGSCSVAQPTPLNFTQVVLCLLIILYTCMFIILSFEDAACIYYPRCRLIAYNVHATACIFLHVYEL